MKKVIISICALIIISNAKSQHHNLNVSVFAGMAVPVGKFAEKKLSDDAAAFAKIGESLSVAFNYQINKRYGLSILSRVQSNKVDTRTWEIKFLHGIPNSVYNINLNSGNWKILSIMVGGYYQFYLRHKFYLDINLMAGILKTTVPKLTELNSQYATVNGNGLIYQDTTEQLYTKNKNPLDFTFSYLIATKLKYKLDEKTLIFGTLDFSSSSPTVTRQPIFYKLSVSNPDGTRTVIDDGSSFTPIGKLTYKQPISSLNISLGVEISLSNR